MIGRLRGRARHLRWKLVAGFTLSVALLLALLTVSERLLLQRSLTDNIAQDLTASAGIALKSLPTMMVAGADPGTPPIVSVSGGGTPVQVLTTKTLASLVGSLSDQGQPSAIVGESGAVLSSVVSLAPKSASPRNLQSAVLNALVGAARPHLHDRVPWTGTVSTPDGNYLMIVWPVASVVLDAFTSTSALVGPPFRALMPGTGAAGSAKFVTGAMPLPATTNTLLIARSLAATEQTVQTVTLISLSGAAVVLALTIMLSLLVVRSALRPLAAITGGAERLATGDYDYRLAGGQGTDEVGRLASAFDRMATAIGTAFDAQRRFVADASHELRTPLTALRGYTDVLLLGVRDDPETAGRVLHAMQDDLLRMSRLVNDLLTLARLDGKGALEVGPLDLKLVVEPACEEARVIAGCHHAICLEVPPEPLIVIADRDRLRQVLSNMLGNACTYATDHTPIQVSAARLGEVARVTIADQGPGMPPEVLARLGERFYRGDAARSRQTGGTGLGIAIARGVMRAHGGSLEIASAVGRGTTITLTMPIARIAGAAVDAGSLERIRATP